MSGDTYRIVQIELDEKSVVSRSPQVDHERKVAIYDLLEDNSFRPLEIDHQGPYALRLSIQDNRLVFDVDDEGRNHLVKITLPISVMKRVVRDYFMICESYFKAIRPCLPARSKPSTWAAEASTTRGRKSCARGSRTGSR